MTQLQIDVREVIETAAWLSLKPELAARILVNEIMAQSMTTVRRVKQDMPVDTGRARASWASPGEQYEPGDAVWSIEDGGLTVVQGSNVEYVVYLNEGHSQQAPAGFIDAAAADADEELERRIADAVEQVMR